MVEYFYQIHNNTELKSKWVMHATLFEDEQIENMPAKFSVARGMPCVVVLCFVIPTTHFCGNQKNMNGVYCSRLDVMSNEFSSFLSFNSLLIPSSLNQVLNLMPRIHKVV